MRRRGDERGQTTLLTVGFLGVLGVLAVVVVNASGAFIERQRLNGLADGAAIAAADALDLDHFYAQSDVALDADAARHRVAEHVATSSGVRVAEVRVSGDYVTVRLEREVDLALALPGLPRRTLVVSEATGRLHRPSP
ncbi:MAG: pilus assembly protein TadG-related protein [Aeromicrobium sp.]|uniref:pilus assembly protein TadG-related protein n=1 Tax=Aeromicrobium sp. TaxID=1871063 RepID=UPI0039E640C3